ncbi:alpha/beta hydrolase family protein [Vallitalea guaymasensis]|uniref:alpha/beta hydrolase family protein n=1 Tax=Vallitalea guaymasensis TaxID=1185412 RepID=UPI00272BC872|nr:hypothetical protein [Vallitalea guaymasensis]
MNKGIRLLSVLTAVLLLQSFLLSGCSTKDNEKIENNQGSNTVNEDKNSNDKNNNDSDNDMDNKEEQKENNDSEIDLVEYNLGSGEIKQSSGVTMPYDMVGAIAIPKEGEKHPIVFVLHGSHVIEDYNKDRYDLGFEYLLKSLAEKGFLAVTINVNAQHVLEYGEPIKHERLVNIVNDHLTKLESAIKGESDDFGIDLKDKGDLTQIALIGHSRGGGALDSVINDQKDRGNDNIFAMLKVAPANVIVIENDNPDIPTGIILPQYDGDVVNLDGQTTFDILKEDKSRKSFASLIFLKGAGHNFFNDNVTEDDREFYSDLTEDDRAVFLTREQQRQFLIDYSVDFLNKALGKKVETGLFNVDEPTVDKAYGLDVKTSYLTSDRLEIIKATSEDKIKKNDLQGNNVIQDINVKYLIESYIPNKDELLNFDHPSNFDGYGLFRFNYSNKKGKFTIEIPVNKKDMSDYKALSLYLALNPDSELNKSKENQVLAITLKDNKGKEAKVILDDNTAALTWPEGHSRTNEYTTYWSLKTPLSEARIPLKEFKDLDFSDIASITLQFDQKESGSILLRDISLTK